MKVIMLKTIKGKEFSFIKGEKYKALDGDEIAGELVGKILVKQPNSPKGKNWWCAFSKSCIGKEIALVWEGERKYVEDILRIFRWI